ncbi:MAG: hypothetical protein ACXVMS_18145 [Flavisolibacter sp.]
MIKTLQIFGKGGANVPEISCHRHYPGASISFENKSSCLHKLGCLQEPTVIFFKVI